MRRSTLVCLFQGVTEMSMICLTPSLTLHSLFQGMTVFALVHGLWFASRRARLPPRAYTAANAMLAMTYVQVIVLKQSMHFLTRFTFLFPCLRACAR